MSALAAPPAMSCLDRFIQQVHTDLDRLGYNTVPKVSTMPVDLPVLEAEDEFEALRWHSDGVAVLTERQADQWSDGILIYRYATSRDGDRCVVTWPVSS